MDHKSAAFGMGPARPRLGPAPLCPGIRGLLFEPANVFYDDTLWRRWLLRLLTRAGVQTHYRCFFRLWDRQYADDLYRGQRNFCETLSDFLRAAGLPDGMIKEVRAGCATQREALADQRRALPGVVGTLAELKRRGLVLAAIANTDRTQADLGARLTALGIGCSMTAVLSSRDLGLVLPEALAFEAALAAMRLPAAAVAFISTHSSSLAGAHRLGMPTVVLEADPDAEADLSLACLADLLSIMPARPLAAAA